MPDSPPQHVAVIPQSLNIAELIRVLAERVVDDKEYENISATDLYNAFEYALPLVKATIGRRLNSHASINAHLPPEILLCIFALIPGQDALVSRTIDIAGGPMGIKMVWELYPVIQVCHQWGELALDCSTLWSTVLLHSEDCREPRDGRKVGYPYLHRRTASPIYLFAYEEVYSGVWKDLSTLFPPCQEALVEEIHLLVGGVWPTSLENYMELEDALPQILRLSMNGIRRIAIRNMNENGQGQGTWWGLIPLFNHQPLTALESLTFINTPFLPSNPIGPALTRVTVSYTRYAVPPSIFYLLHFLEGIPALEKLYLHHIPHDPALEHSSSAQKVSLRRLQKLSLNMWDMFSYAVVSPQAFLERVDLPSTCFLRVDTTDAPGDLNFLASYLHDIQWSETSNTTVHCTYDGRYQDSISSLQATTSSAGIRIDIHDHRTPWGTPSSSIFSIKEHASLADSLFSLLLTPPFARAHALYISGYGLSDTADLMLTHPLHALAKVNEMYIVNELGRAIPKQFIGSLGIPSLGETSAPVAFPDMSMLYVSINFKDDLDLVSDVLRRRVDAGSPITHLLIGLEGSVYPHGHPLGWFEDLMGAVGPYVRGEIELLRDNGYYGSRYSLRNVLPPQCTDRGGEVFVLWPSWTEGEEVRNVPTIY